jgi:hypothetical protein
VARGAASARTATHRLETGLEEINVALPKADFGATLSESALNVTSG